jgi:hypothetical protein
MNIIVAVKRKELVFFKDKDNVFGTLKLYDKDMKRYFYVIKDKLTNIRHGSKIYFYMYGHIKYYAIIDTVQFSLFDNSMIVYFDKLFIFKKYNEPSFKVKKFYGARYFDDVYEP